MFEVTDIVWYNGKIVPREQANPSVASFSLHLGIGVFDGIRAFWNGDHYYIHLLEAHLERLRQNAKVLGMDVSWSQEELLAGVWGLLEAIPPTNYYLRPLVYYSDSKMTLNERHQMPVDLAILAMIAPRYVTNSLRCHLSPIERVSHQAIPVSAKICGSYVNSYLVRMIAEASGFEEGIMLDRKGRITEASSANLFFIQGKTVVTPALTSDIFPGLTRATLINIAPSLEIEVIERDVYPEELENFEAAFQCATLSELKPIASINSYQYNSQNHPLFLKFLDRYRKITRQ